MISRPTIYNLKPLHLGLVSRLPFFTDPVVPEVALIDPEGFSLSDLSVVERDRFPERSFRSFQKNISHGPKTPTVSEHISYIVEVVFTYKERCGISFLQMQTECDRCSELHLSGAWIAIIANFRSN